MTDAAGDPGIRRGHTRATQGQAQLRTRSAPTALPQPHTPERTRLAPRRPRGVPTSPGLTPGQPLLPHPRKRGRIFSYN